MQKRTKCVLVAAACILLTGCPKATSVTGNVTAAVGGMAIEYVRVGSILSPSRVYHVLPGSSITVTYDNGKTCTFTGETEFMPGDDGSVCQNNDNNDNNDNKKQDKKDDKQDQQQDQQQSQNQDSNGGDNGANGTEGSSGINAPQVTPTAVPQYSGLGGPQVIATAVPQYTGTNWVATSLNAIEAAVGIVAVKKAGDKLDDNRDKPISR